MKSIIIILLLTLSAFSQTRPKWVDNKIIWRDSGKVYIKINIISNDLDMGMNSTKSRFRDVVVSSFCNQSQEQCIYYNFTIEGSYWEVINEDNTITYNIYRLFSIMDVYPH